MSNPPEGPQRRADAVFGHKPPDPAGLFLGATKFALVLNLRTAKALGITVPPTLFIAAEAAARHLSFKLAARELHVTPGAVGQQVKALEDRLGVRLLERLHKQLILTSGGQAYLVIVRSKGERILLEAIKPF